MNRLTQALGIAVFLTGCETFLDFSSRDHGTGGTGDAGGGAACAPGATISCYPGPEDTENVGLCRAGFATCQADGSYGSCEGAITPAAEDCATATDEDCDGLAPPCEGTLRWAKDFGDGTWQMGQAIAFDPAGNIIVVASIASGSLDFGGGPLAGPQSLAIAKLDRTGSHLWSRRLGGGTNGFNSSVLADSAGNIVIAGSFQTAIDFGAGSMTSVGGADIFVAKLDPGGAPIFAKRFGDTADQRALDIAIGPDDSIYITGDIAGTTDFGGGALVSAGVDAFLLRLNAAGDHVMSRRYGDGGYQRGTGVAVDTAFNIALAGVFNGSIDAGGATLSTAGTEDAFLMKLDDAAQHAWSFVVGPYVNEFSFYNSVPRVKAGPGGRWVITAGLSALEIGGPFLPSVGNADIFLVGLDPMGDVMYRRQFGDASEQFPMNLDIDAFGNVTLVGNFGGTVDFGNGPLPSLGGDFFMAKFDAAGVARWSKRFGSNGDQQIASAATDAAGASALTGAFEGELDFGAGPLLAGSGVDIFVATFDP